MKLNLLKYIKFFHLINKIDYNEKSQIEIVKYSSFFDAKWYLAQNPDVKDKKIGAAKHYVKYGWKEGRNPGPNFDTEEYLHEYPELKEKNCCPLFHYILEHEELKPRVNYKEQIFNLLNKFSNRYKGKSSDYKLIATSKYFNARWYLKQYPDVAKARLDPIEHYMKYGWKEGRNPGFNFDTKEYLNMYFDVKKANINPLLHYIKCGEKEGRKCIKVSEYKFSKFQNLVFNLTNFIGKVFYYKKIRKNADAKILVILHLFYTDSWNIIEKYLNNLNKYQYKLIVTVVANNFSQEIITNIKEFRPDAEIRIYPNLGFDVGSFIDILSEVNLEEYDIIYKLQSKGIKRPYIFIYNQIFKYKDWFFNLYNGILGGISAHQCIDKLLSSNKVGIVAAKNLIIHDPKHKQYFTREKANEYGINVLDNYKYVAGTCFAIKASLLKPIKNLRLSISDFENTQRGTFSLAHAMERLICAIIETQGYKYYGINILHHRYIKSLKKEQKYSAMRLLKDSSFDIDYDFFYKVLELRRIKNYEVKTIKLKDIKRYWQGKYYSLTEVSPFAYLKGNKARYTAYCTENSQCSNFVMSKDRFDVLINSLDKGYNVKKMPILNAEDLSLMDGQHRCCYLVNKYGLEHSVKCLLISFC